MGNKNVREKGGQVEGGAEWESNEGNILMGGHYGVREKFPGIYKDGTS